MHFQCTEFPQYTKTPEQIANDIMVKSVTEMYKYSYACGQHKRRFYTFKQRQKMVAQYKISGYLFWGMPQVELAINMQKWI